jgi:hypothetical protein
MLSGARGSRLLDRRPPHYRCPAVPGLSHSARAILMARDSSVHPSGQHLLMGLRTADCSVLRVMRTADGLGKRHPFGSRPRRPSSICSGLEPHCRTSRHARPQPTPFTGEPLTATAVLLAAAPDHCGPPGPVVSPVAFLQQLWLRNSTTAPRCALQLRPAARQFISARPCGLPGYERNHIQAIS